MSAVLRQVKDATYFLISEFELDPETEPGRRLGVRFGVPSIAFAFAFAMSPVPSPDLSPPPPSLTP